MVANAEGTTPGAGWFADPAGSPYLRWWDGSQWTDNFIDAKTGAPPGELPAAPSATPAAEVQQQSVVPEPITIEPVTIEPVTIEPVAVEAMGADPSPVVSTPAEPLSAQEHQDVAAPAADSAFAPGSPFSPIIPGAYVPEVPVAAVPVAAVPVAAAPAAPVPADVPVAAEAPVAGDPGPTFPEQTFPEQTYPVTGQLTRRQARIMQEMEEARAAAAAENAAGSTAEAEPAVAPVVAPVVPPVSVPPVADYTQAAPPSVPPVVLPPNDGAAFAQQQATAPPVSATPVSAAPVPAAPIPVQTPIVPPPAPAAPVQAQPAVQDPIVVPVSTPPTPFDASTVAPPVAPPTAAPAAWPFAAAADPQPGAAVVGATAAVAATSAATPWMSAPPPGADSTLPLEKPPYEPMARARSGSGTAQEVFVGGTSTWAIWAFAALPILHLAIIWYVYTSVESAPTTPLIRWGVLLGPIVFYLLLAAVDLSILKRNGHMNLPSVLLAIIPVFYLAIRTTRLGVRSIAPLAVWIVLQAAAVVALMLVFPTIYSQITAASEQTTTVNNIAPVAAAQALTSSDRATQLTPTGMQAEITKELAAKGTPVTAVTCPPLTSTQDGTSVTCSATADSGKLAVVIAVNSANQQAAFDIVSSNPA